jgi:cytidylate kinase
MHEQPPQQESTARQELIEQMRAVTISREYGSGGGEIAGRLAERLNWQLVDHQVVTLLAQRAGVTVQEAEVYDEHAATFIERLLTGMRNVEPAMLVNMPPSALKPEELYHRALHQVVTAAARERHTVIVGRGSQIVLKDRRDVLHVRIVAPLEQRIHYVTQREGLDRETARNRIQLKDKDRHRYLQIQYQCDSANPHLYDLVCNTSVIDLDHVVELICHALASKATRLKMSTEELGPAASAMSRYPARPGDFRPPASIQGK